MRRSELDTAQDAIYAHIPKMTGCDGSCWISCGPIDMTARETARIREAGYRIPPGKEVRMNAETYWCPALTGEHRCAVYEIRPLICRLWGTVESMQCPYGCVPEGGYLTDDEAVVLLAESLRLDGYTIDPAVLKAQMEAAHLAGSGGIRLRMQHALPSGLRRRVQRSPCPHCGFTLTLPDDPLPNEICSNCRRIIAL